MKVSLRIIPSLYSLSKTSKKYTQIITSTLFIKLFLLYLQFYTAPWW